MLIKTKMDSELSEVVRGCMLLLCLACTVKMERSLVMKASAAAASSHSKLLQNNHIVAGTAAKPIDEKKEAS